VDRTSCTAGELLRRPWPRTPTWTPSFPTRRTGRPARPAKPLGVYRGGAVHCGALDVHDDLVGRPRPREGEDEVIRFLERDQDALRAEAAALRDHGQILLPLDAAHQGLSARTQSSSQHPPTRAIRTDRVHFWAIQEFVVKRQLECSPARYSGPHRVPQRVASKSPSRRARATKTGGLSFGSQVEPSRTASGTAALP
jgi:hypothetical protein